jgi:predicted ribosomally synthesized peptide with SipW-like signal peptide
MARKQTTKKLLLSLAVLGLAASVAGIGTYAAFTRSTTAFHSIATGTVAINLGTPDDVDNRLTVAADGLVPGDSVQRRVVLTNPSGNENLASITLTTTANVTSLLDTDTTDGLQLQIQRCAGGTWDETVVGDGYTYACNGGVATDVLAVRDVIGSNLALTGMQALTNNNSDDMVVTLSLPSSAGNSFQTLTSEILFTFTATQRAGDTGQ